MCKNIEKPPQKVGEISTRFSWKEADQDGETVPMELSKLQASLSPFQDLVKLQVQAD